MTISKNFLKIVDEKIPLEGRNLIFEFFITFSRFECALKSSIEFANGGESKVEPNWDRFISAIATDFARDADPDLNGAVEFILTDPPKVQALAHGALVWRSRTFSQPTQDIHKLCLHIRDIRNNLFHGGKFNGNYERDVSRNHKLITSALIILNDWLSKNAVVKANFESSFS